MTKAFAHQTRENDPRLLLEQTIGRTNGFFRRTYYNDLPQVAETALQQLALHLGNSACFTLVDHRDVGRLYEHVVQIFQKRKIVDSELGQHYTPIAIAEKMLQHLPIEQIRPEERYIFDHAGSGSLLLAATKRLALMPDVAMLPNPASYLADHVMGNDLDERAHLVSELRYTLMKRLWGNRRCFLHLSTLGHLITRRIQHGNFPIGLASSLPTHHLQRMEMYNGRQNLLT
ncbi:MAG: N-6 DNA methylase [Caldilineaceae bacterium]